MYVSLLGLFVNKFSLVLRMTQINSGNKLKKQFHKCMLQWKWKNWSAALLLVSTLDFARIFLSLLSLQFCREKSTVYFKDVYLGLSVVKMIGAVRSLMWFIVLEIETNKLCLKRLISCTLFYFVNITIELNF